VIVEGPINLNPEHVLRAPMKRRKHSRRHVTRTYNSSRGIRITEKFNAPMLAACISRATVVPIFSKPHATTFLRARWYSTPTEAPLPNKSKVWASVDEAVKDVKSGDILLCGGEYYNSVSFYIRYISCTAQCTGFGLAGVPGESRWNIVICMM